MIVIDDHQLVGPSIKQLLFDANVRVVGVASDFATGNQLVEDVPCDVAIVDLDLPGGSGLELTFAIRRARHRLKVLIYTGSEAGALVARALRGGADGAVSKRSPLPTLAHAIRCVHAGGRYVDPAFFGEIPARTGLSERERQILELAARGYGAREIADELVLSLETMRTHVRNARIKLGASNLPAAVAITLRSGDLSHEHARPTTPPRASCGRGGSMTCWP